MDSSATVLLGGIIRVLIVDDCTVLRELLAARLDAEPDLKTATVDSTRACLEEVRRWNPAVVLLEAAMAGQDAFSAARTIGTLSPQAGILFTSRQERDTHIEQALQVGARGYISQRDPIRCVFDGVRAVASGRFYFSPRAQSRLVVEEGKAPRLAQANRTLLSTLSAREMEVLAYIAIGLAAKEIARTMHLSPKTVETHAARLMHKLNLRDRVALTRYAIREGLVEP